MLSHTLLVSLLLLNFLITSISFIMLLLISFVETIELVILSISLWILFWVCLVLLIFFETLIWSRVEVVFTSIRLLSSFLLEVRRRLSWSRIRFVLGLNFPFLIIILAQFIISNHSIRSWYFFEPNFRWLTSSIRMVL